MNVLRGPSQSAIMAEDVRGYIVFTVYEVLKPHTDHQLWYGTLLRTFFGGLSCSRHPC